MKNFELQSCIFRWLIQFSYKLINIWVHYEIVIMFLRCARKILAFGMVIYLTTSSSYGCFIKPLYETVESYFFKILLDTIFFVILKIIENKKSLTLLNLGFIMGRVSVTPWNFQFQDVNRKKIKTTIFS
jgi:hypothetical protein